MTINKTIVFISAALSMAASFVISQNAYASDAAAVTYTAAAAVTPAAAALTSTAAVAVIPAVSQVIPQNTAPADPVKGVTTTAAENPAPDGADMVAEEKGPENLSAVAKGTRVYLTWNEMPKSDSRITYNIYRATSPDDDFMLVNRDDIKTNSFIDDRNSSILPLTGGTLYYYMAAAVISGRETAGSNIVQAMPQNILEPPSGITIISHASGATLKWSDPEEDTVYKASGYNIYRATEGSMVRINTDPVKETVYDDSGLTNGVKYYYSLQSVDFRGNTSDMSFPPDSVVPFDLISAPKNVTSRPVSSESIKISWDAPENTGTFGVSGYNIYRSSVPGVFSDKPVNAKVRQPVKDDAGKIFYFDNIINSVEKPEPEFNYFYKVVPVDFRGNTGASGDVVSAVIPLIVIKQSGTLSQDISEYGLPPDSKLTLSGKKSLGLSYEQLWAGKDNVTKYSPKFDIQQKLKLMLNGNIGTKIIVDVNYDETLQTDEYTKISIKYAGEKEEALQEVSFGDMSLDLPATRYVSYSQTLFGIKGKVKIGDKLSLTGIGAQTKGITEIQSFKGNLREMEVNGNKGINIADTSFYNRIYYYITKDTTKTIKPGSVVIYYDDLNVTSDTANTKHVGNFGFDRLYAGVDYTVDYQEKVIKFNIGILDTYVIVIGYQEADGTNVGLTAAGDVDLSNGLASATDGHTSSAAHLLQDGRTTVDISHKVLSYYYMGATQIYNPLLDTGYFVIRVESSDGAKTYNIPRPQDQTTDNEVYTIDMDNGIIKFKSPFPFAAGASQPVIKPYYADTHGSESDCYNLTANNVKSNYRIHLEYRYYVSSYKLDHFPVVYGSERVELDGTLLKKDVDYYIFYDTGEISFVDAVKKRIGADSDIKIVYEYFPYMQTYQSNLFGARADYQLLDNFRIGGTWLYKSANAGSTIPDAHSTETALSTPYSSWVLDGDVAFSLDKEGMNTIINALPGVENSALPVDYKFAGEMAYSNYNPNIFDRSLGNGTTEHGVAMIDNMEGADNAYSCNMVYTSWFPASPPYGVQPTATNRVYFDRSTVQDKSHEYQTGENILNDTTVNMLNLNFSGLSQDKWEAFRYILSSSGDSYKLYNYIEMWVYVNVNQPVNMYLDLGVISEDSNGTGVFQYNSADHSIMNESEDYEINGKTSVSNDTGISSGIYPANPVYWGSKNNTLDTEDMNSNGRLDTTETYYEYSNNGDKNKSMTLYGSGQWVNIKIPLKDFVRTMGSVVVDTTNSSFLSNIKHLRMSFRGTTSSPASGTIKIESIKFTGNSWQLQYQPSAVDMVGNVINAPDTSKFNLITITQNQDNSYTPNLYFFDTTTDSDKKYETALDVKYNLSNLDQYNGTPIYYATKSLSSSGGYDYHQYKYLRMDILYKKWDANSGPGKTMLIRIGSGTDETTNYIQFNEQLTQQYNDGKWHTVVFAIDGSDDKRSPDVGTPVLTNMQYITLGFVNPNSMQISEEIYVDNIRLTDPTAKQGGAKYLSQTMNYQGVASVTHTFEDKDSDFYTLADAGRADIKQHTTMNKVDVGYTQIPFMPMTNSYTKSSTYVDDKYVNDPSYTRNNTVVNSGYEAYSNYTNFTLIPDLPLSFSGAVENANSDYLGGYAYESNRKKRMTLSPSFSYSAPKNLFFVPLGTNNITGSITWENTNTSFPLTQTAQYYDNWRTDRKQDYRWTGSYTIGNLSLQPVYEQKFYEAIGNQTTTFDYYKTILNADSYNYIGHYIVLSRDIIPSINIGLNDIWIFSPQIGYDSRNNVDYTSNLQNTTGDLSMSTGINFSKLFPFIPNITKYKISVNSTAQYNETSYPGSFREFESMTFERKWNAFMWQYFYNENEINNIEDIAQSGTYVFSHDLLLSEINIMGRVGITPGAGYSTNRSFSSRGAVQSFNEIITLSGNGFHVDHITIPVPYIEDFFTDQKLTGDYSYRRTLIRDTNRVVTNDTIEHAINNVSLSYSQKDGVSGSLMFSARWRNVRISSVNYYNNLYTPTFNLGYNLRQSNPITIPGWLPFIGDKTFKFEQVVNLNLLLQMNFTDGRDINEPEPKKNANLVENRDFRATISASYNALQNLKIMTDLTYYTKDDDNVASNRYSSIKFSVSGEIEF